MTRLIDADKAERDIEELRKSDWFNAPYLTRERKLGLSEAFDMIQGVCIKHAPTVDAIPIEWINQRVKGLKIQLINADEDDVDLIWHLRDEIQTLTELIDYWKAEQEKQK